ncbi:hypothetical protein [Mycobacterium riyadhense]|uniref:Uncharacterized protein n=1 Tax=Mycobacterium riyadhense TaxID=486698 RepID=A0A1X2BUQ6_9MYCO|nr:hypothetical protein [Mycobacterium riyadhense]MCV7145266.1 hypothetical protein [Mycobacterium riyadhense]ORW67331.1 hypothetical protein AWC22_27835 [Mycobacterium riyadhense]VTP01517.1 hypothetical protein BIN_B_04047 [Mycobacterium riyadhense]
MTTMTMNFIAAHRVTRVWNGRESTLQRMGRRLTGKVRASLDMTAQDRADRYVAMTPIAVLAA